MGVTLTNKATGVTKVLGSSNKYPEGFSVAYEVTDGTRVALVSAPMVDALAVWGVVPASVYAQMGNAKVSGQQKLLSLFENLTKDPEIGAKYTPGGDYGFAKGGAKKGEKRLLIPLGPRPAWALVSLRPHEKDPTSLILRVEWNPRKSGRVGVEALIDLLVGSIFSSSLEFGEWLSSAQVTKLEIAVDVLNVERCDLRAKIASERKVQAFRNPTGGIETTYHRAAGALFPVKLYDKRQYYLDTGGKFGKKPKFGDTPHCRVERSWRFGGTSARPLVGLQNEPNRLTGFHVRWLRDEPGGSSNPQQRLAAAALDYLGRERAVTSLSELKAALKLVEEPDPDFWRPDQLWSLWPAALEHCGLDQLTSPHAVYGVSADSKKVS